MSNFELDEPVEGQYGDYRELKVGDRVKITTYGHVVEVGKNYADVEVDDGDEVSVGICWDVEVVEDY